MASVKIGSWIAISNLRSAPAGKDCEVSLLVIRHQRILTDADPKKRGSHEQSINHQKDVHKTRLCEFWHSQSWLFKDSEGSKAATACSTQFLAVDSSG